MTDASSSSTPEEDDPGPPAYPGPSKLASSHTITVSDSEDSDSEVEERTRRPSVRNRDLPEEERLYYQDSDEEDERSGAAKAEMTQAVWCVHRVPFNRQVWC